jgi:archaeal preflagellin peptidase FlaK
VPCAGVHLEPLDVVRLFAGVAVLGFASYTDWRWRRAPNLLWWLLGGLGAALLLGQAWQDPSLLEHRWPLLAAALLFAALAFAFYWLGLLAGGADAKALMALAILLPLPLHLGALPLWPSALPPAFGALGNALVAFLLVPLGLLGRNLLRGDVRFPHALLALKLPLDQAQRGHYWPMEHVQDGEVRTMLMPSRFEWEEEDFEALRAAGRTHIWATPKVPFMIPLLVGVVLVAFVGDLLAGLLLGLGPAP